MTKLFITLLTCALFIGGCSTLTQVEKDTQKEHIEVANDLQVIMGKFNALLLQEFNSKTELDEKSMQYREEMITLVEQLAQNSKELKDYSKNESELFIQYADELAKDARNLRRSLANKKSNEEIKPTLENIERLCYQCHATLHE